ncbi:MAG TPA: hypothetical protein DDX91_00790 [Ruminococcaceae bacterium]|nr:hypothetical protein [Oscillospiraceae bacterium]
MANATSALRMSGMNSGLDTEAIVNALTATTKNKINKNERKVLKLQAQQEAYRSIIAAMTKFQNKYCSMSNIKTCLKSGSLFDSYKSTLSNSAGTNVNGVTVSSSTGATPATYNVKVGTVATQSVLKSSTAEGKPVDISECTDENQDYLMTVSVGGKSKNITVKGGSEAEVRDNINAALKDAFGITNNGGNKVYIGSDNKFVSVDKQGVTASRPTVYSSERNVAGIDVSNMKTGTNSFTITVGDTTKTVSFSSISADYFDEIFEDGYRDGAHIKEGADATKVALFKQIAENQRQGDVYDSYGEYEENFLKDDEAAQERFAIDYMQYEHDKAYKDAENAQRAAAKEKVISNGLENINKNITFDKDGNVDVKSSELSAKEQQAYDNVLQGYQNALDAGDISDNPKHFDYMSFETYYKKHMESEYKSLIDDDDIDAFWASEEGQYNQEQLEKRYEAIEKSYEAKKETYIKAKQAVTYEARFKEAKQAAYDAAVAAGDISDQEGHKYYCSLENFKFSKSEFESGEDYQSYYNDYLADAENIKNSYDGIDYITDFKNISQSNKAEYYDKELYTGTDEESYLNGYDAAQAVRDFNTANIQNNLGAVTFKDEFTNIKATVNDDGTVSISGEATYEVEGEDGSKTTPPKSFAITQGDKNANDFGFDAASTHSSSGGVSNQISTAQTIDSLGLTADENGKYNFKINGVSFSFKGDATIKEMMNEVNASSAGVKMSYTTLTNQFTLTANEYGRGTEITFEDGGEGLLGALGFDENATFTEGQNTTIEINGEYIETTSNSYTVDGTTFTFTAAAEGTEFTNEVKRDYSPAIDAIKSFVEDYNKLIDEVYGYVDDEPNKDYYFLTDDDKDEMDLSESQEEKWDKLAKKGILYRDSTLQSIMSSMRTALYSSVDAADGTKVGLYRLGITTTSNWADHGKLQFSATMTDAEFESTFAQYADEFAKLFNDAKDGIAYQFDNILNGAVKTSGAEADRGVLVQKAGVSGTASATTNSIYNQIRNLKNMIDTLKDRYDQQQERYWSIYSNMETMLGNINGQSSYIQQLMGSM